MIPKGRSAIADVNFAAVLVFVGRALHLPDWRDVRCHVRVSQTVVVSAVLSGSQCAGDSARYTTRQAERLPYKIGLPGNALSQKIGNKPPMKMLSCCMIIREIRQAERLPYKARTLF